jgi:DNA-binding response OmpR family regulator
VTADKPNSVPGPSGDARRAGPLRIVVVDDEPDTVVTLLMLLREQGYDAEGFGSGKAALEAIAKLDPDVVVSDIAMPRPNGWDVAKEVRRVRGEKPPPLMIAISGQYTKGSDRILAQMAGFNYYLTKPCDPQVLIALVEQART